MPKPIYGFRQWSLETKPDSAFPERGCILVGAYGHGWTRYMERAICPIWHNEERPFEDCHCGVYAYNHFEGDIHEAVTGVVKLGGTIEVGEVGYRAEWASIQALNLPELSNSAEVVEALDKRYRCPVGYRKGYKELWKVGTTFQRDPFEEEMMYMTVEQHWIDEMVNRWRLDVSNWWPWRGMGYAAWKTELEERFGAIPAASIPGYRYMEHVVPITCTGDNFFEIPRHGFLVGFGVVAPCDMRVRLEINGCITWCDFNTTTLRDLGIKWYNLNGKYAAVNLGAVTRAQLRFDISHTYLIQVGDCIKIVLGIVTPFHR